MSRRMGGEGDAGALLTCTCVAIWCVVAACGGTPAGTSRLQVRFTLMWHHRSLTKSIYCCIVSASTARWRLLDTSESPLVFCLRGVPPPGPMTWTVVDAVQIRVYPKLHLASILGCPSAARSTTRGSLSADCTWRHAGHCHRQGCKSPHNRYKKK